MITPEGIIQRVTLQDISTRCTFVTTEETDFFKQFTTSDGILFRITYLEKADSLKKFPVYHLTYDDTIDEFHLNADYFDKENETVIWVSNEYRLLKWVCAFKKEYVLTYPNGLRIGNVFKQKLPTITRI